MTGRQRNRRPRTSGTRISTKHQITIPVRELRASGLRAGDRVTAHADGPGRVILERVDNLLEQYAGALTGVFELRSAGAPPDPWD